jgi:hypothetical protein
MPMKDHPRLRPFSQGARGVFYLLAILQLPAIAWAACDDPPARRVNWLRCDKQGC